MFKINIFKMFFILGGLGWFLCIVLVYKLQDIDDIQYIAEQQHNNSLQIKDLLMNIVSGTHSKYTDNLSMGKDMLWPSQLSLAEKYCSSDIFIDEVTTLAECDEILKIRNK
ncbi:hypothetical protein UA38_16780 [Photobacterium kishitanii]|uniref:Uncharacterized protein n=1 Tax=Photobacterium kishitanii TaxID=318456 RepID=A0AAX0YW94_9GAMM|nr:hypothetical protein [Photobacterium kishitanii]KJG56016.1 hypothetical protein UA38_16780 [Photobacterium kishitanii]KJG64214.1 hypothetical protein UA40_17915 [Photobacterium kishitanii]PSX20042.1 hypothetical protein C0W70_08840 [Photobacterium kishitanii]PSX27635.1 hypothetical protein C0W39_21905 [Photobacterium kishitanii]PSX29438.1 hypothetical protein C0W52_05385 [Photobacterium kishitanii]